MAQNGPNCPKCPKCLKMIQNDPKQPKIGYKGPKIILKEDVLTISAGGLLLQKLICIWVISSSLFFMLAKRKKEKCCDNKTKYETVAFALMMSRWQEVRWLRGTIWLRMWVNPGFSLDFPDQMPSLRNITWSGPHAQKIASEINPFRRIV